MTLKITIEQLNWDGQGNTRTFTHWVTENDLQARVDRIERAYNMSSTRVTVTEA